MNKYIKKILTSCALCLSLILCVTTVNAASMGVSINKSSGYVGDSFTVSISGINGKVNITSSSNVSLSSSGSVFVDGGLTISGSANSKGNATITVTAVDATTTDANPVDVSGTSRSVSFNVQEKVTNTQPVAQNTNTNNNNNTSNNSSTSSNNSNNSATNANNNNTNNNTQSSNNYLASLQVSEEGLTPDFVKTKTNYSLIVPTKVTELRVDAVAEDSKAQVSVSGNKDLKDGDNNLVVTVTAQNGAIRHYTIVVTRTDDANKTDSYLDNLIIAGITLSPEFSSEVLEYDGGTIKLNDDKLEIYAYPKNENAKVEIIGNENLVFGENTITIKVTSEDGSTTKEYVIKFVKEEEVVETNSLTDVSTNDTTLKGNIKNALKKLWNIVKYNATALLLLALVIVEYVEIIYLYKKVRKYRRKENIENNKKDIEDNFIEENDNEQNELQEADEIKALDDEIDVKQLDEMQSDNTLDSDEISFVSQAENLDKTIDDVNTNEVIDNTIEERSKVEDEPKNNLDSINIFERTS